MPANSRWDLIRGLKGQYLTFIWPCIMIYFLIIKPNRRTNFSNLFLECKSTFFGQFLRPSSGVFSLYTRQWYMSYRFADSLRAGAYALQWKTPDDGQRNCPKHVDLHFKNKFEKLVHLVGFIIRKMNVITFLHLLFGLLSTPFFQFFRWNCKETCTHVYRRCGY